MLTPEYRNCWCDLKYLTKQYKRDGGWYCIKCGTLHQDKFHNGLAWLTLILFITALAVFS